jgi:hypothetical protein
LHQRISTRISATRATETNWRANPHRWCAKLVPDNVLTNPLGSQLDRVRRRANQLITVISHRGAIRSHSHNKMIIWIVLAADQRVLGAAPPILGCVFDTEPRCD